VCSVVLAEARSQLELDRSTRSVGAVQTALFVALGMETTRATIVGRPRAVGLVDAWSGGIESPAPSREGDRDPGSLAHVGERRSCKAEVHGFESLAIHQNRGVKLVGGASYTSPTTLVPAE
jgi:hypothetical protein